MRDGREVRKMCWRLFFNPLISSTSRVDTDERRGIGKMRYRAPSGKGRGICWFPNGRYPSTNTSGCSDIEVKVGADHQRCFAARLFTSTFDPPKIGSETARHFPLIRCNCLCADNEFLYGAEYFYLNSRDCTKVWGAKLAGCLAGTAIYHFASL